MNRTYDKFQVVLLSEVKGKDSNAFIFELRLTSEDNCRIRIIDFDAFDIDGNKYSAGEDDSISFFRSAYSSVSIY